MCEFANKLGGCPLEIKFAGRKRAVWCENLDQQALCGNAVNMGVSKVEILKFGGQSRANPHGHHAALIGSSHDSEMKTGAAGASVEKTDPLDSQ